MKETKLNIHTFFATFFGIGFMPYMPGTWGSAAAFCLYLLIPAAAFSGAGMLYTIPIFLAFCLFSVYISTKAELTLGHDAGSIVIDEVCGFFVAVMFLPKTYLIGVYALIFFRVFDIAKPFPISRSQNLPKGWGVVVDDILAGLFANVLIQIIIRIYPKFFGL
ncbi:MAG: phosphatidylglycerophosphatase A [Candidatus Cloacimonetes bacterium]|nr:phosphatidylglycerophosphatase A [Candidatus Cloacimonadota bacterium]